MSSNHLTKNEYEYLCMLLKSIDSQNWRFLEGMILANPSKFTSVSNAVHMSSEINGMTILHACIRFNPPPSTLKLMLRLSPASAGWVDCLNRTALHVAAGIRASPKCIKMLVDTFPEACMIQDADGKTALHFACDVNCELFQGDEGITREPPSFEVVSYLVRSSLESLLLEDEQGMSALECAIMSDADISIIKFLMQGTKRQCLLEQTPATSSVSKSARTQRRGDVGIGL